MRLLGFVVVTFCVTAPASAQSAWFDLPVPTAALTRIDISLDDGRTLVAPRAIRVLHRMRRLPPYCLWYQLPCRRGRQQQQQQALLV